MLMIFFQLNNNITRGHPYKLYKPFSHCRARTSFFSITVISVWNDLPADVDFRSVQSFKTRGPSSGEMLLFRLPLPTTTMHRKFESEFEI